MSSSAVVGFLVVLVFDLLPAQDSRKGLFSGRVLDDSTGLALPNVNVFLSGTSLGTTTNEKGEFNLRAVPPGTYELITSFVGYHVDNRAIRVTESAERPEVIRLKPKIFDLPTVEISAPDPGEWRGHLETFTELLFGYSQNASSCTILNPYVVDFEVDPHTGAFTATARQPLEIENRSLGYKIEYVLRQFEFKGSILKYYGHSRFSDLEPADGQQRSAWRTNRLKAYRGSLQHLLASLAQKTVRREGFLLQSAKEISLARSDGSRKPVTADELLVPTHLPFEKRLSFPDYLEVRYLNEPAERGFARFLGVDRTNTTTRFSGGEVNYQTTPGEVAETQISWLRMNLFSTTINTDGALADPRAITTYGYMSYERLAEMLPLDFMSGQKEAFRQ